MKLLKNILLLFISIGFILQCGSLLDDTTELKGTCTDSFTHECTDFFGDYYTTAELEFDCTNAGKSFSLETCSKVNVWGSCVIDPDGDREKKVYYSKDSGGYTNESDAANDCQDNLSGLWIPNTDE